MSTLREYTVVGFYDDGEYTRLADSYVTDSPEKAEAQLQADYGQGSYPVVVAGVLTVVAGAIEVVA